MMVTLPPDEVMRELTKLAFEKATEYFAKQADEFADVLTDEIRGPDALRAFARAIRSTNARLYPTKGQPS